HARTRCGERPRALQLEGARAGRVPGVREDEDRSALMQLAEHTGAICLRRHSITPSWRSSHRLRSSPPPYPVSVPLLPITRWHGITMPTGFEPLAAPTARDALGVPIWRA